MTEAVSVTADEISVVLQQLNDGERIPLEKSPRKNPKIPQTTGIYALWLDETDLMYVGIVRSEVDRERNVQSAGLAGRLHTYHRAPLAEKAILQIALVFLIPRLAEADGRRLLAGELDHAELSTLCRQFVRKRVSCTTVTVNADVAAKAEAIARRDGLPPDGQPPMLNPDQRTSSTTAAISIRKQRQDRTADALGDSWAWEQYRNRYTQRPETFDALVDVWCNGDVQQHFPSWSMFSRCALAEPERARNAPERVEIAQAAMERAGYVKAGTGARAALAWKRISAVQ